MSEYIRVPYGGMIQVSRVSGSKYLYGSPFDHQHYVQLTIRSSCLCTDGAHSFEAGGDILAQVWMSSSQYAEMISAPNIRFGVPCTLRHIGDTEYPIPDSPADDVSRYHAAVDEVAVEMIKEIDTLINSIREGKIPKSLKIELINTAIRLSRLLNDKLPFIAECYHEKLVEMSAIAKAEVQAQIAHIYEETGRSEIHPQITLPQEGRYPKTLRLTDL